MATTAPDPAGPTDVLIVGAGPVGLTLANDLAKRGVSFRIIDSLSEPLFRSKAHGLHARTTEMLYMLGLGPRLEAESRFPTPIIEWNFGTRVTRMDTNPASDTLPPGRPVMQQQIERVLEAALLDHGHKVERGVRFVGLDQDDDGVDVQVQDVHGDRDAGRAFGYGNELEGEVRAEGPAVEQRTIRARWVVGTDGSHSAVRKALGLAMEGKTLPNHAWVTECDIEWDGSRDVWLNAVNERGRVHAIYVDFTQKWHVFFHQKQPDATLPTLERLTEIFREITGRPDAVLRDPLYIDSMGDHHQRMPNRFQVGRTILAGDAAHAHTAAGGQGMNTGIQDALNLGWKLALALQGTAAPTLLATYEGERLPNARQLLVESEAFKKRLLPDSALGRARTYLNNKLAELVPKIGKEQRSRMAMMHLNVRTSPLTAAGSPTDDPAAGDFLPSPQCRIGPHGAWLRDILLAPEANLLLVAGRQSSDIGALQAVEAAVAPLEGRLRVRYLFDRDIDALRAGLAITDERIIVDSLGHVREQLHLGDQAEVLYVRPDGFIGLRTSSVDAASVLAYLGRIYDTGA